MDGEVMRELAARYVWWKSPDEALAHPTHLLCQLMEDVRGARALVRDGAFRDALRHAPPGVLDARSWNYWHLVLFGRPPPPLPTRLD